MNGLTPTELRLVEQYVWVLDYVSRCALGVDRGDWFYLSDKAGDLAGAAQRLSQLASEAYQAATQGHGPRPPGGAPPGGGGACPPRPGPAPGPRATGPRRGLAAASACCWWLSLPAP